MARGREGGLLKYFSSHPREATRFIQAFLRRRMVQRDEERACQELVRKGGDGEALWVPHDK